MTRHAELQATSNFSFLRGGSHPDELVMRAQAKALGLEALALTDRNTLAGVVRAHAAAKEHGLRFIVGCRLDLGDGPSLLAWPTDRASYGRLSKLLTLGKRRAAKGDCALYLEDLYAHAEGLVLALLPGERFEHEALVRQAAGIRSNLSGPLCLAASHRYCGDDAARIAALADVATRAGTPLVATGDVLYHHPARRPLQDLLTCIREKCTIETAGFRLQKNAERHLKSPAEMARLFRGHEGALARTVEVMEACRFSLDELRYNYPSEPVPTGKTPQQHLEALTWEGAALRWPEGVPAKVEAALEKELKLIAALRYAPYFLTVHDIVHWARARGILCQGRGSAANSAVCYCLHITSVNPAESDLLFERFLSAERAEPPDIDVDFEHERREEAIQYIYARYGRARAGIAATVIRYRARSAVREVGKAMGLSEDVTAALAGTVWGWGSDGIPEERVREAGLDPTDRRLKQTLALTAGLIGFPRHLSQHVGGFVLTQDPLEELVPIGNAAMAERTFIEWDKDDLDTLGILKIDIQSVKTVEAGGPGGYDAGKKIKGRKRHAMVDTDGRALVLQAHPADVQDRHGAIPLLRASRRSFPFVELAFADSAYNADRVRDATSIAIEIVKKLADQVGFRVLPGRRAVARTFAWINRNRRPAKDFEGTIASAAAFLYAASVMLLTRRLARSA